MYDIYYDKSSGKIVDPVANLSLVEKQIHGGLYFFLANVIGAVVYII